MTKTNGTRPKDTVNAVKGRYLKQPKVVTLVQMKKRKKSMKMENIRSADEEDEPDNIPEGFQLHEQSLHCINMK